MRVSLQRESLPGGAKHKLPHIARGAAIAVSFLVVLSCVLSAAPKSSPPAKASIRLRRPIAAAFLDDGRTLCVANRSSGTLMLVDVPHRRVGAELPIGKTLADLAVLPDRKHVLALDEERHELIALDFDGSRLSFCTRLSVAPYPVSIAVQPDGHCATVVSLWSRRLQVVDLAALSAREPTLRILHTVRLPFAPRCQCVLPRSSRVVVADAFGGRLAVVDAAEGRLGAAHELKGHNVRGLAVSGDGKQLLVAHQILDQQTPTLEEKIWRGSLMTNVVRTIPLEELSKTRTNQHDTDDWIALKGNRQGAGDPAGLAILDADQFAIALAGVNEVAVVSDGGARVRRLAVGRRPTAVVCPGNGAEILALNTFDDSLSVVDVRRDLVTATIDLGQKPALTPAERGELLFFDARLSRAGWFSCHSCHTEGHTNGLLADTLGDGTHGTPKRTLTLRGTALTDPWAWDGSMKYLQDQIEKSLTDTMHAPSVSGQQINDLLSYLHTLPPPPPLEPVAEDEDDRAQVERGHKIFHRRGCVRCHIPPLTYSSHDVQDVGFADERGLRKFNPPSLRGVGQGYGFLHDNRAATLEEVFSKHHHKVGSGISPEELADLLRFLRSL